jgi:hypothetical protein
MPETFSATGQGKHREGFVVEFSPAEGQRWVGNFQPGLTGFSGVFHEPGTERLVVTASGKGYVIEPATRQCVREFGRQVEEVLAVPEGTLIFSNGLWLEALGPRGLVWKSRRLSWDGIDRLRLEGDRIEGLGLDVINDKWLPFSVDLTNGEASGGACPPELPRVQRSPNPC